MPLLNLLCLVVLASMANSLKRPIIAGITFALLKVAAITFLQLSDEEAVAAASPAVIASIQFVVNAILGIAIGYLVVRQSKERKATVVSAMLLLSLLTFLADQELIALLF